MKRSEQTNEIAKALSKFQGQMKPAVKDSSNPHFRSKFASINSVWEAIREPLNENMLYAAQDVTTEPGFAIVETEIHHESGQWMQFGPLRLPVLKQDAQGYGSAITYAKRYALCAALGVVSDEDDDGNAATRPQNTTVVQRITKEQADELHVLFNKCPENFRKYVLNKISTEMKIGTFFELPANCYDSLRLSIEQNMTKQIEESK